MIISDRLPACDPFCKCTKQKLVGLEQYVCLADDVDNPHITNCPYRQIMVVGRVFVNGCAFPLEQHKHVYPRLIEGMPGAYCNGCLERMPRALYACHGMSPDDYDKVWHMPMQGECHDA